MKEILVTLSIIFGITLTSFGQSQITNVPKGYNLGMTTIGNKISGKILLVNGYDAPVPVKLDIDVTGMTEAQIKSLTDYKTLSGCNITARFGCQYPLTYVPTSITVDVNSIHLNGYAKTRYGVDDNIYESFIYVNGYPTSEREMREAEMRDALLDYLKRRNDR